MTARTGSPIVVDLAALEGMVAVGASAEMILAVIRSIQTTADVVANARRKRDAARKRKSRASEMSRGHCVTSCDIADANEDVVASVDQGTQDVVPVTSEPAETQTSDGKERPPHTPLKENTLLLDGGDARAREARSVISDQATAFATELAKIAGHDPEFLPPRWISDGPGLRVQMMLDAGWSVPVMRDVARATMRRKRDGSPFSIRYFEPIFAKAHAPQLPLPSAQLVTPLTEQPNAEVVRLPAADWRGSRDRFRAARAVLEASVERDAERACDGSQGSGGETAAAASATRR